MEEVILEFSNERLELTTSAFRNRIPRRSNQASFSIFDSKTIAQVFDVVENKIQKMTWSQIYATSSKSKKLGLNWEVIEWQKTAKGGVIASIRITQKSRARVTRDGKFMRFIRIHPDHDPGYLMIYL